MFRPTGLGTFEATLNILTDINANIGSPGATIPVRFFANVVPEPSTGLAILLGIGAVLMLRGRAKSAAQQDFPPQLTMSNL